MLMTGAKTTGLALQTSAIKMDLAAALGTYE